VPWARAAYLKRANTVRREPTGRETPAEERRQSLVGIAMIGKEGRHPRVIVFSAADGERVASFERLTEEYKENGGAD
jgi:hypothetical protein